MKHFILNQTKYRMDDLRRFIDAGLREYGNGRSYHVTVYYSRSGTACTGYGWYGFNRFKLGIPNGAGSPFQDVPESVLRELAGVLEHEVDHTRNLRHADMAYHGQCVGTWWHGLRIRRKAEAKKPTATDRAAKREAAARKRLAKIDSDITRLKRLRPKWAKKVQYYDRKNRAAAQKDKV